MRDKAQLDALIEQTCAVIAEAGRAMRGLPREERDCMLNGLLESMLWMQKFIQTHEPTAKRMRVLVAVATAQAACATGTAKLAQDLLDNIEGEADDFGWAGPPDKDRGN